MNLRIPLYLVTSVSALGLRMARIELVRWCCSYSMVPNTKCLALLLLRRILSDVVTVPSEGEGMRNGVDKEIEEFYTSARQ